MNNIIVDLDLRTVHEALLNTSAGAAFNRLVARCGNVAMQRDLLLCNAETMTAILGKRAREAQEFEEDNPVADLERFLMQDEEPDDTCFAASEKKEDHSSDSVQKKEAKTSEDDMRTFLSKPTKMKNTLVEFHKKFGNGECSRSTLIDFMMTTKDVIHHSSVNKVFHPPKGFANAMLEKTADGNVRACPAWLSAADL
nr:hypothetical protein TetV2_00161 [Oceanusvirus sp.]